VHLCIYAHAIITQLRSYYSHIIIGVHQSLFPYHLIPLDATTVSHTSMWSRQDSFLCLSYIYYNMPKWVDEVFFVFAAIMPSIILCTYFLVCLWDTLLSLLNFMFSPPVTEWYIFWKSPFTTESETQKL